MTISYAERERMPAEEREKYLAERLRQICEYAYENAPVWKKRFDEAGVDPGQINSTGNLEKIPVTTRDELVKLQRQNPPFGGFLAVPVGDLKRIYVHPGPQYETLAEADVEHVARALHNVGLKKGDITINALAYHLVPAGLLLDDVLTSLGITVVPTGFGNTDLQVQIMHDLKATVFIGFPNFLMIIIKRAEELGYDFRRDFALKRALALGKTEHRRIFEQQYGLDATELYGFAPIGVPACECEQKNGMHIEEDFIVEIVDPATGKELGPGEIGEVVVTTVFNETIPRIRFGSGDLSLYTDEPCPCGRTSNRLVRIVGRVGEAVKVRGMFLHPLEVEDVICHFPQVSRFQLTIGRAGLRDTLVAKFELAHEAIGKENLVESFHRDFQSRCRLRVDKVDFVPQGTIPEDARKVEDQRKEIIL